jgi:hypothetical protein
MHPHIIPLSVPHLKVVCPALLQQQKHIVGISKANGEKSEHLQ